MIIFRHLCRELYSNLLAIILILLIIFITNQFIHYLKDAANGRITMTAVMQVMSLQIPLFLGYLLPLSLYLSILISYGRMYVENEITVLSSCGMSRLQLLGMTLVVGFVVMLIVAALMLWVEPIIEAYQGYIFERAVANASIEKIVPKRFQQLHKDNVFYVDQLSRRKQTMYKVFLAQASHNDGKWDVMLSQAARKQEVKGLEGKFIVFQNGHRYIGAVGQKDFQTIGFQHYGIRLDTAGVRLDNRPEALPTYDLWHLIHTEKDLKEKRNLQALLQWRFAMPISVILFTLLAFPLSEVKPRSGKFARLFPAILIYIVYADLMFLGRAWIEQGAISPSLGLWWIHGGALGLAIILNGYRMNWFKKR